MINRLKLRYWLLTFLLLTGVVFPSPAQQEYKFKARISTVGHSGFYKIHLQPSLMAKCNDDLSDLRIIDNKTTFIPYTRYVLPQIKEGFINFPIQSSGDADTITSVVIRNDNMFLIGSLWLELKNTAVFRTIDLQGSDDMKKWYAIDEDIILRQAVGRNTNSYFQRLSFPANNYRYFKVDVYNQKKNSSIRILRAGIYNLDVLEPELTAIPLSSVTRKDSSDKSTYLTLSFKDQYQVNKLKLFVTSPKYFRRQVTVYENKGGKRNLIAETELSSDSKDLMFSSKTDNLEIRVENGDNQALQINQIQAFQRNEYILAYLEQGNSYQLLFGHSKAKIPDYDLKYFIDTALREISETTHSSLIKNSYKSDKKQIADYNLFMWISIIIALGVTSLLSWRIIREIKESHPA